MDRVQGAHTRALEPNFFESSDRAVSAIGIVKLFAESKPTRSRRLGNSDRSLHRDRALTIGNATLALPY